MKTSLWSLAFQQSVFQRYRSEKHLSQFYPQDGGKSQLALKLRHCHPVYRWWGMFNHLCICQHVHVFFFGWSHCPTGLLSTSSWWSCYMIPVCIVRSCVMATLWYNCSWIHHLLNLLLAWQRLLNSSFFLVVLLLLSSDFWFGFISYCCMSVE